MRNQCLKANQAVIEDPKELKVSLKVEKEINKELQKELRIKEKALAETAVMLISEARENAARLKPACDELNISERTYQRWTKEGDVKKDQRPLTERTTPKNKLIYISIDLAKRTIDMERPIW